MKSLHLKYKEIVSQFKSYSALQNIQLLLLLIFTVSLTLSQKLNSLALFVFLFTLLFSLRFINLRRNIIPVLIFTLCFFISVFSLYYSSNKPEGYRVLERQLALLFIPVIGFTAFKIDGFKFHLVIRMFFISIVMVSAYLLEYSAEKFMIMRVPLEEWFVQGNMYHAFARPVGMHATYLSLYVGLGIFIGFDWIVKKNNWKIKVLVFLGNIVLLATLLLLSSRMVISSVVAILFLIYPFFIGRLRYIIVLAMAGVVICSISIFLLRESNFIKDRFLDDISDEIKLKPFLKADSTYKPEYGGETRADRWFCAIEIIKEKPGLGCGTGSEKEVLMQKYQKYNLKNAEINNYDAHNQYLAFGIKSGIIGITAFLISILYAIYTALKNRNFLYLAFTLLFSVSCITENVLESNKGIFFYAFFNFLFCSFCLFKKDEIVSGSPKV
ncbi:hypothetical protein CNR22_19345 [Sphingobacteriaceae bacterium]|nr:hypothetical protein CNR22_19345 [Sphingobacteriaceae bacterium]